MKKALTTLAVSLGMAMSAMQPAQAITIDINGGGAGGQITGVSSLDWIVGNALAVGAVPVANGNTFTLLAHAALGSFLDSDGNAIAADFGLGTSYELTFVTSFRELTTATGAFPGAATFTSIAGGVNYFELWIGPVDANQLAGTGFNNGTRILSGTVLPGGLGSFSATAPGTNPALDQFGIDNYPAIDSVRGVGGSDLNVTVQPINYNPLYFPDLGGAPLGLAFNTSNNLPFQQTNPSALFTNAAGGGAPTQQGATLASLGAVNGINGPNFQFQADANSSFQVPEPATIGLLGLALVALGFGGRRRKESIA